jgi:putative membrane protein
MLNMKRPLRTQWLAIREPAWRRQGEEPDYRFSLANERTFLAWVRTALALLAGGVLLEQIATHLGPHAVLVSLATALAALAALLSGLAYVHWRASEIAMRNHDKLPGTMAIPLLTGTLVVVCAVISMLLLLQ